MTETTVIIIDTLKQHNKKYYEEHKDAIKQQTAKYYRENIDKYKANRSQPYTCSCGSVITHTNKTRHEKSKKHNMPIK